MICANSYPIEITKDTRIYRFTNRFNIIDKTNLVWKNSHNTNNTKDSDNI